MTGANPPPPVLCPICRSSSILLLLEIDQLPVHCHLLWPTREGAIRIKRGDMRLCFCRQCSHTFNAVFQPEKMAYTQDYDNSLHFSKRFQAYALGLAERLVQRYDLCGKNIVEIGSGKGDFLATLCALGDNRGVGFDPSSPPSGTADGRVHFVRDCYSERYANYPADIIVARHVLEHVADPMGLLSTVRRAINGRRNTVVFAEVPNALFTLGELGIWDLIYEHCSYFTSRSLEEAFRRTGFDVLHQSEEFGGQFLTIEALPGDTPLQREETQAMQWAQDMRAADAALAAGEFGKNYRRKVHTWKRQLSNMAAESQRVVVWGAGSKGITFLNVLDTRGVIEYVVDVNPRKVGMHVAGTGQEIIAPESLVTYQPDVVIIMNTEYVEEIKTELRNLGLEPRVMLA